MEEQRRRAGLPPLEAAPVVADPDAAPSSPSSTPEARGGASGTVVPGGEAGRTRPADRLITVALLAYGLVNVITTGLSYLDLPVVMNQTMDILGIEGEFTNFAQGKLWGTIAAAVLAVGWTVTAMLSVRRLRRRKVTWWVPLAGAAATMLVVSLCLMVPMLGDPAFIAHLDGIATR